jgi:hypothetical protein
MFHVDIKSCLEPVPVLIRAILMGVLVTIVATTVWSVLLGSRISQNQKDRAADLDVVLIDRCARGGRRRQQILHTDRETSQPNRAALEYWADGLEPVYLEGALARAQR